MANKAIDDKEKERALKKLIGETATGAGAIASDERPQKAKDRIARQAKGDLGVEDYVKETAKRGKKKR
jgi:hypothetical protein